jgi:hypothetical protein
MSIRLCCPSCGQSVTVLVPIEEAWCGKCAKPLVRESESGPRCRQRGVGAMDQAMTREQYVNRSDHPQLWPGWTKREDGRWYSTCRCPGCVGGFSEDELADSFNVTVAAGYVPMIGAGWTRAR